MDALILIIIVYSIGRFFIQILRRNQNEKQQPITREQARKLGQPIRKNSGSAKVSSEVNSTFEKLQSTVSEVVAEIESDEQSRDKVGARSKRNSKAGQRQNRKRNALASTKNIGVNQSIQPTSATTMEDKTISSDIDFVDDFESSDIEADLAQSEAFYDQMDISETNYFGEESDDELVVESVDKGLSGQARRNYYREITPMTLRHAVILGEIVDKPKMLRRKRK